MSSPTPLSESRRPKVAGHLSEGLGILTLLAKFWTSDFRASVEMDASAAMRIVQQQGLSKMLHVEVEVLQIQEQQARRLMPISRNLSDMGTKNISSALMDQYLSRS